jgi:hypothetical protein
MHNSIVTVSTFAGQRYISAAALRIERCTKSHQVADRLWCLHDELTHDGFVAEAGACGERVSNVILDRV